MTRDEFVQRWRQWVPAAAGFFLLLVLLKLSNVAYHRQWWFRHQYELLIEIQGMLWVGLTCVSFYAFYQFMVALLPDNRDPLARWVNVGHLVEATFWTAVAMRVGMRYIHMCDAGSRWIELGAAFGMPIVVALLVFLVRPRWLAYALVGLILGAVWMLARPYLNWAHGEPISWFG